MCIQNYSSTDEMQISVVNQSGKQVEKQPEDTTVKQDEKTTENQAEVKIQKQPEEKIEKHAEEKTMKQSEKMAEKQSEEEIHNQPEERIEKHAEETTVKQGEKTAEEKIEKQIVNQSKKHAQSHVLNAKDEFFRTPLQVACENGSEETVEAILRTNNNADINSKTKYGFTALELAAAKGIPNTKNSFKKTSLKIFRFIH